MPIRDDDEAEWKAMMEGDRPWDGGRRSPLVSRRGGGWFGDEAEDDGWTGGHALIHPEARAARDARAEETEDGVDSLDLASRLGLGRARAISDPAERLKRQDEELFAAIEVSRLDSRRGDAWRKSFDGPGGLAAGFAETEMKAFDEDARKAAKGAPSPEARAMFLTGAAAVRRRHLERLSDLEGGLAATKKRIEVEGEIGRLYEAVRADPDGYEGGRTNLDLLLGAGASLVKPERAEAVRAEAERSLAESMIEGLIGQDRLEDAESFLAGADAGGLPLGSNRTARLRKRLGVAASEREAKAAAARAGRVLTLETRVEDGAADEAEIGRAFAAGDFNEGRRDGLLARAEAVAEWRAGRCAQRRDVAERLAAGAAFDPRADRDAVEAYADEVLVPGLVEAEVENDAFLAQTTDFAARTGVWPRRLRGWIEAQLQAGAPGHAGPAAQALARVRRTRPDAVADAPRGEIAFAMAAARLIEQGVAAEPALARTRPLRGLPEAADAETRAAEAMELRAHYREWLGRDAGSDMDAVDAATVGRFAPAFEDWFFRTGDAGLSRDLAFQDLRLDDLWRSGAPSGIEPEPLRIRDDLGDPIEPKRLGPDVHRPGWTWEDGYWRPDTTDDARNLAKNSDAASENDGQSEEGEPPDPDTPDPDAPPQEPSPGPAMPKPPVEKAPLDPLPGEKPPIIYNMPVIEPGRHIDPKLEIPAPEPDETPVWLSDLWPIRS